MRMKQYGQSIDTIDALLKNSPNDPYYNELKGQILFEFGKKESIYYFQKALNLLPQDPLMQINYAIVAFNIYNNNPSKLSQFIPYIKFMQNKEPDSLTPYYYLSLYYGAMNNAPLSQAYLAVFYDRQDDSRAKIFAKSAFKLLKAETAEWYWVKDIIERE
jgi:predicted Zn-dependent protease